jgi:hypothetical protein
MALALTTSSVLAQSCIRSRRRSVHLLCLHSAIWRGMVAVQYCSKFLSDPTLPRAVALVQSTAVLMVSATIEHITSR